MIAPEALWRKLVQAKQAADFHTPSLNQRIIHEVLHDDFLARHVPPLLELYRAQCDTMLAALAAHMPPGVKWNCPEGGMFIWLTLPAGIDSGACLEYSLARHVADVPGAPFYARDALDNTLRLSFVTVPAPRIKEGVARLAEVLRERLART